MLQICSSPKMSLLESSPFFFFSTHHFFSLPYQTLFNVWVHRDVFCIDQLKSKTARTKLPHHSAPSCRHTCWDRSLSQCLPHLPLKLTLESDQCHCPIFVWRGFLATSNMGHLPLNQFLLLAAFSHIASCLGSFLLPPLLSSPWFSLCPPFTCGLFKGSWDPLLLHPPSFPGNLDEPQVDFQYDLHTSDSQCKYSALRDLLGIHIYEQESQKS